MSKKICLIDGSGYIFRAFYALPAMTGPDGTPVNAVYGFTNMFLKLTQRLHCDYCLVLFDAKRQNFRNNIFPEYKGTRKETPEDLIPQFAVIREALDALNINYLDLEGFEADDLIATYAEQSLQKGYDVTVISADKDLMQLIRPHVEFYDPMKDKFYTPEDVKEKFGVYPEHIIDVQALAGDSIDNIPGVPGIGLKTAAELVNQFGSLENVLTRAAEIKQNKRRETLLNNLEQARISMQLVTLKKDVPLTAAIEEYPCQAPEKNKVVSFVEKYGFSSLRARIEKWADTQNCSLPQAKEIKKQYEWLQTETRLKQWCAAITETSFFAFNTISSGSNPQFDKIIGISLAVAPGKACYIQICDNDNTERLPDLFNPQTEKKGLSPLQIKNVLLPFFNNPRILKISHNTKQNIHFMTQILGSETKFLPLEDVEIISYVLDSSDHGHGLAELASLFLDYSLPKLETLLGSGRNKITFNELDLENRLNFAAGQADITLRLYHFLKKRLIEERKITIYEDLDRPLISVLQKMEGCGIMVDAPRLQTLSKDFNSRMQILEQQAFALAGEEFNLGSPKQIGEILFGKFGAKGKKTATGAWQTGADILEDLAAEGNEFAGKILDWRALSKLKSTYTDALLSQLDKNARIHTTFNQTGTNTGRLASSDPNLQNIPIRSDEGKKIRECFIARPGCKIIAADYSQVELRLLAATADVKALKHAFIEGLDIHAATASKVFGVPLDQVNSDLRRHAKAINFGIVYGISQYGLAKQINVPAEEAKAYIDAYFRQMPEIKEYMDKTIAFAHKNGYVLTPMGRKCSLHGINDQNKRLVANAERAAINAPMQGGAADIIKIAMRQIDDALDKQGFQTKMLLQVHDELVFEAPENEVEEAGKLIKTLMENVVSFDIPFIAEVGGGNNWNEAH